MYNNSAGRQHEQHDTTTMIDVHCHCKYFTTTLQTTNSPPSQGSHGVRPPKLESCTHLHLLHPVLHSVYVPIAQVEALRGTLLGKLQLRFQRLNLTAHPKKTRSSVRSIRQLDRTSPVHARVQLNKLIDIALAFTSQAPASPVSYLIPRHPEPAGLPNNSKCYLP